MATPIYPLATLALDGLPILECTSFSFSVEGKSKLVQTAGHSGVMKARGYPKLTGSLEVQVPKTGHEYGYLSKLVEGNHINVRWIDSGVNYDGRVIINKLDMSNNPVGGERNCTIAFEGDLVSPLS